MPSVALGPGKTKDARITQASGAGRTRGALRLRPGLIVLGQRPLMSLIGIVAAELVQKLAHPLAQPLLVTGTAWYRTLPPWSHTHLPWLQRRRRHVKKP